MLPAPTLADFNQDLARFGISFNLNYLFTDKNYCKLFIFIHLLNVFGPIPENVKIVWAGLEANWNGPTSGKMR